MLLAVAATPSAGPAAAQPAGGGPPPALVRIDQVREELLEERAKVTGALRAPRRAMLSAEATGRLLDLRVEEGDVVEEGQVVATIDDAILRRELERQRAAVTAARAAVVEAEAALAKARRDLPRVERLLRESQAVSQSVVDDARTALEEAEARLAREKADVTAARADEALAAERLEDATVRAPFTGRVVAAPAEAGEWVTPGEALLEVVALDPIEAWLQVPEEHFGKLSGPDASLELSVPAVDERTIARVTRVVPDIDLQAHTFPVLVRVPNPDGRLAPGMRVVAQVPTSETQRVLTVHPDAILRDASGARVFVVTDGAARPVRVETLFLTGSRVAVRAAGLSADDELVVEGNERLMPGQPVRTPGS